MGNDQNVSVAETQLSLERLQSEITLVMVPALTFLSLLLVTGVIGNCLVLLVYGRRFPQTPLKMFIKCMAAYGLVTVTITLPGEMYESLNKLDFNKPIVCKIKQFIAAVVTIGSALLVLAVAVTRYIKICRPFGRQVSVTQAKTIIAAIIIISLVLSVPYGVIHGSRKQQTSLPGIHGYECDVSDDYAQTVWPTVVVACLMGCFVLGSTPMLVMYFLVARTLRRHRALNGKPLGTKHSGLDRTSCMLLAMSLVFILSFLPFFALGLFNSLVSPAFLKSVGKSFLTFFHLFHICFLLNGAINPFVYSLCDFKFRNECVKLLNCFSRSEL